MVTQSIVTSKQYRIEFNMKKECPIPVVSTGDGRISRIEKIKSATHDDNRIIVSVIVPAQE